MKRISLLAAAALLSTSLAAQEGAFVGAHYGSTSASGSLSAGSTSVTISDPETTGNIGFSAGYNTNLEGIGGVRGYVTLDTIAWADATATTTMVSGDYLYTLPQMKELDLFAGVSVGTASFEIDTWDSGSGSAFGIQLGGLFNRGDNIDYEFGYRSISTSAESTTTWSGTDLTYSLDNISQIYIGANYHF